MENGNQNWFFKQAIWLACLFDRSYNDIFVIKILLTWRVIVYVLNDGNTNGQLNARSQQLNYTVKLTR